ncbi:hypothetical protein HK414_16965 [Ramlibacter terrae]|uniref:Uncharacterized protein n=1 Tax=Ramlibacter terrae TaxID=2732511 RepID=A0ABX6P3P6_9BURK|nr:hypothetical protein HK414_16965 [Ramlibacter terrae]
MSAEPSKEVPVIPQPVPGHSSGNGADTALEALIRQRKRGELPDDRQATPPDEAGRDAR